MILTDKKRIDIDTEPSQKKQQNIIGYYFGLPKIKKVSMHR